ncbi:MAG: hypothetical protein ACKN9W_19430 [Methylococcus sp.]
MKSINHPGSQAFARRLLISGSCATLLMACAETTPLSTAKTEQDACVTLQKVIGQAGNDFNSLKGAATTDYDHTRWDAPPIIAGTDCDIVAWGGGRTNYACTWNQGDETSARADYAEGLGIIQRCLGPTWQVTHPAGQTGKATQFAKTGENTKLEVRYYKERDPSRNWQTSLTIGPAITRDAR